MDCYEVLDFEILIFFMQRFSKQRDDRKIISIGAVKCNFRKLCMTDRPTNKQTDGGSNGIKTVSKRPNTVPACEDI